MPALYNEIEPYAADWLVNLEAVGHIASGIVERRSIRELQPDDVRGAVQFHAFAGVGVWSYALRLAEWPDDVPVWTGSCPCQPFSQAGRRLGTADDRHLWPDWFRLIRECRPPVVFGEQVASPDGLAWLGAVQADMEGEGYAFGAADLCAAGVGAPHIRQRLYFVAHATEHGRREERTVDGGGGRGGCSARLEQRPERRSAGGLADTDNAQRRADSAQRHQRNGSHAGRAQGAGDDKRRGGAGFLGDAGNARPQERPRPEDGRGTIRDEGAPAAASGVLGGFWTDADWLPCLDGKLRPVEPGTFPLAHGAPARVGRLRAYGNAIVPQVAATFIRAAVGSF